MKRTFFSIWIGFFILFVGCAAIWAQATAQISGTAKDQSGAVLPGVEITVTQTGTATTRSAVTNETGSNNDAHRRASGFIIIQLRLRDLSLDSTYSI